MAEKKKGRKKYKPNNDKATWENTAKEQPYLMPGTVEYQEYQDDLMTHDPFKPDDEWHEDREDENEDYRPAMTEKFQSNNGAPVPQRKHMNLIAKQAMFNVAKSTAVEKASRTKSKKDDKIAAGMDLGDVESLTYNDGVTPDDYVEEVLEEYGF